MDQGLKQATGVAHKRPVRKYTARKTARDNTGADEVSTGLVLKVPVPVRPERTNSRLKARGVDKEASLQEVTWSPEKISKGSANTPSPSITTRRANTPGGEDGSWYTASLAVALATSHLAATRGGGVAHAPDTVTISSEGRHMRRRAKYREECSSGRI